MWFVNHSTNTHTFIHVHVHKHHKFHSALTWHVVCFPRNARTPIFIPWSLSVMTQWQHGLYCQIYYLWHNLMCRVGNLIGLFVIPAYGAYGYTLRRHHPKCIHKITIQEWQTAGLFHCWLKQVSPRVFDTSPDKMITTKTFSNLWQSISSYTFSEVYSVVDSSEESGKCLVIAFTKKYTGTVMVSGNIPCFYFLFYKFF